jgi:CubicO group peptidase (beta-lactamase class C family)
MKKELRILLADDQERVRYGLRALLRQQPGWKVIGEAENAKSLLALAAVINPDLVLLDWNLSGMPGEKIISALHQISQCIKVIVLSGQLDAKISAHKAGADSFVWKTNSPVYLIETILSVTTGDIKQNYQHKSLSNDTYDRFAFEINKLRRKLLIPGMSAGIVKNQNFIWGKGFGYADLKNKIKVDTTTPYHLASLTKPFASIVVMQLVEDHILNLDDSISNFGIDIENAENIAVKHILSMTSEGIPGEAYAYNGDRFLLFDEIIKVASGKTFQDLLFEWVIKPLKLTRTIPAQIGFDEVANLADPFRSIFNDLAKPYKLNSDLEIADGKYPSHFSTAAGLISTVEDLAKFDIALDQNILISEHSKQKMFTPTISNSGAELPYGLGWYSQSYQGAKFVWHWGQWDCVSSLLIKALDENTSFILLANSENLSKTFDLGRGNVLSSPFATLFCQYFCK